MNAKLLVVLLLIAGLATAGWFAWGADGPAAPTPAAANDGGGAESVTGDAASGQGGLADTATAATLASTAEPGERVEAAGADPGATVDGNVAIRGRLVGENDEPLAAVELAISEFKNPDRAEFLGGRRDGAGRTVTTDGGGRFRFELERGYSASLELPSADLIFAKQPAPVHSHRGNQDLGDLAVRRSATVGGVVRDEFGAPVEGVTVAAHFGVGGVVGFGGSSSAPTGKDGVFRVGKLRPGEWTLRTASPGHLPTTEGITVAAGERLEDVQLTVRSGSAISGQVIDDLGRPVPDFKVAAKRIERSGGVDVERFAGSEAAVTDASGFFTLAGLAGETVTVRAFGSGHGSALAADVPIGTGDLVMRVDRLATIEGVLKGADGAPLEGSRVRAVAAADDSMLRAHGIEGVLQDRAPSAKTAADGTFRIEGVPPGKIDLTAEGEQHRPARQAGLQVAPAQLVKGVQLVAERGAVARVTVVDADGNKVAGAKVHAERPSPQHGEAGGVQVRAERVEDFDGAVRVFGDRSELAAGETDENGVVVLAGLPAESVVFSAEHREFAPAGSVTLPLSRNARVDVDLELRTPGYAELHVLDASGEPDAGAKWAVRGPLQTPDEHTENGKTDDEGRAVVGPLAAGNYVAELRREAGAQRIGDAMFTIDQADPSIAGSEQRFRITAGKTETVELRRPQLTRLFGTVTGADGPIGAAVVEIEKDAPPPMPGRPRMVMGGATRSATTASDGTFEIADVEAGNYVVRYGRRGQIVKAEVRLEVAPELPELQQDLVLRAGRVRVQAWSEAENRPIAGAEVTLSKAGRQGPGGGREVRMMMVTISTSDDQSNDSTMMTIGAQRAITDAEGWAEIEDVPVGEYDLRITDDAHVPGEHPGITVNELQTTEVDRVMMGQAGRIRGRVLGEDGKPVRMAMVSHRPADRENDAPPTPAMGGSFTIDSLPTGRHVLRAQALQMGPGGGGPQGFGPEVEVEVKAGETATVDLRLPPK
ncbi:MAG: carboxypeptidase regulatory-like domain-containing protein [Planctomycetes bacterium]|nr:carboxypeptidase regulatory-like domain-containing protein [Planctomycetota bacterium]